MKKILTIVLCMVLVFSFAPMMAVSTNAETVQANALVITQENLDQYLEVGTKAKKNDSAWVMQSNDNVTVEADGTISFSLEKGSTIGNVNFFILKKALNQDLIEKAGGKIVVEISNVGLAGPQTVQLFRLPFSNTGGTGYAKGINADSSYIYNITLPESEYSTINSDAFADDIRGEGVVDNRANLFMAQMYNSSNNTYAAPEKFSIRVYVQVDESLLFDPEVTSTMDTGASIRLNNDVNGIRFVTKVDATKIAELKSSEATVQMGTLIAPSDLLNGTELTFNCGVSFVNIEYNAVDEYGNIQWYKNEEGMIAGSLVNIRERETTFSSENGNIARKFVGRGYVKVTKGNDVTITYADYAKGDDGVSSVDNNTRSLAYVANAYIADTNSGYGSLDGSIKALVENWASKLSTVTD